MSIVLTNQTAFPLNVSFCHQGHTSQHKNELDPGQSWSFCVHKPAAPSFPFWKEPTTVLTVNFDHGVSFRFSGSTRRESGGKQKASRLLTWLAIFNLAALMVLATLHYLPKTSGAVFWHSSSYLQHTKYLMMFMLCVDAGSCFQIYRVEQCGSSSSQRPANLEGGTPPPALSMVLPSRVLQPNGQTINAPLPTAAARLDRHLALMWWKSGITLWDMDRDQPIITPHS